MQKEKSKFIPTEESGEITLAVLNPAKSLDRIIAKWRRYDVVYMEGWGEPSILLWTLWYGPKLLQIFDKKSGKEIKNFCLPERFQLHKDPIHAIQAAPYKWEITYDAYHTIPTGEESAHSKNKIIFDLQKMHAEFEITGFEIYD